METQAQDPGTIELAELTASLKLSSKWTKYSADGSKLIVTLRYPVELAKEKLTAVELRTEVLGSDLEAMNLGKGDVTKTFHLVASLSGLPVSTLRKMRSVDVLELQNSATYLMGKEP